MGKVSLIVIPYTLRFAFEARTSRASMHTRKTWFLGLFQDNRLLAIGECGMLPGLSYDDRPDFESFLFSLRVNPEIVLNEENSFPEWPSVQTGIEMLRAGFSGQNPFHLFPGAFASGEKNIPINGLIWMGDRGEMRARIREKLDQGWKCLKLKVGSLDFETECAILAEIRREYSSSDLVIRLDANGAFAPDKAMEKLMALSDFGIHSIEQPIRSGQWEYMAGLCRQSPIPVALDEELIGVHTISDKRKLLEQIRPSYLVLKPTLHGGFRACEEWIELAGNCGTGWWATSYLESDLGLNAIAQWVDSRAVPGMYQGLGTGSLYTNNLPSPLVSSAKGLRLDLQKAWDLRPLGID